MRLGQIDICDEYERIYEPETANAINFKLRHDPNPVTRQSIFACCLWCYDPYALVSIGKTQLSQNAMNTLPELDRIECHSARGTPLDDLQAKGRHCESEWLPAPNCRTCAYDPIDKHTADHGKMFP